MVDRGAVLPPSLLLDISVPLDPCDKHVIPHLMPFSIEYNGPAAVNTYFIMRSPGHPGTDPDFDPMTGEESNASFRGRYLHGKKISLPKNYKISFFQRDSHGSVSNRSPASHPVAKSSAPMPIARAPVRGSRFSLDDDEDDGLKSESTLQYTDHFQEPEDVSMKNDSSHRDYEHTLSPIYYGGNSFWIWNPDGPIDAGGDPFIQTCQEWLLNVAPAVCFVSNHRSTTRHNMYVQSRKTMLII